MPLEVAPTTLATVSSCNLELRDMTLTTLTLTLTLTYEHDLAEYLSQRLTPTHIGYSRPVADPDY